MVKNENAMLCFALWSDIGQWGQLLLVNDLSDVFKRKRTLYAHHSSSLRKRNILHLQGKVYSMGVRQGQRLYVRVCYAS